MTHLLVVKVELCHQEPAGITGSQARTELQDIAVSFMGHEVVKRLNYLQKTKIDSCFISETRKDPRRIVLASYCYYYY